MNDIDSLSEKAKAAMSRIQERNERRRVGILRGLEFSEWEEFMDRKHAELESAWGQERKAA